MLTLIESGFTSLGGEELIKCIKRSIDSGRRTYLIVPEQQTLSRERGMCDILPPSSARLFEVTNFTRFANTAFRTLGGISGEYCTGSVKALIMWRTLTEISPLLKMTETRSEINAGTVSRALEAINEMKSLGISPTELFKIIDEGNVTDNRLSSKLSDLYLIFSTYKKLESERFSDITDDMLTLADMLRKDPAYLDNTDIYIDGFTSFTEPQYKLISELMRSANLTVTLTIPKAGGSRFEYSELRAARSRLLKLADSLSVEKKLLRPDGRDMSRSPLLSEMADMLWLTDGEIDRDCLKDEAEVQKTVRIYSASVPIARCDFIAADITRRVMAGAHYSDFAIIARRAENYTGILDSALERADVPYFFSRKRDISSFEAIKLINTAYSIIARGYAREDVITYLKCGLTDIEKSDIDLFELYVERWSIDGAGFTHGDFEMNPRGYEPLTADDLETLKRINSVREHLTDTLSVFHDMIKNAVTVEEHASALFKFFCTIGLEKNLYERSLRLYELGEPRRAEENSRLFGIICSSLDLLVDTVGDMPCDSESFRNQLMSVLNSENMGSIPSHVDEVTVGSADMIRLSGKKHVYLIGVNDGEFPSNIQDNSYFSDKDRALLTALGLSAEPELEIKGARELYSFTRAFTFAKESVTLLYSRRSSSLSPLLPSEVIGRIRELTKKKVSVQNIDTLSISERLFFPEGAYELDGLGDEEDRASIREALLECGHGDVLALSERSIENDTHALAEEAVALIYDGDIYLSQSRIDAFLKCPFSYFLKNNLKLDKNERAELSSNVIGSFIHAILEDFFRESRRLGGISSLTEDDKQRIAASASERYVRDNLGGGFGNERTKITISRLCRAAMPVIDGLLDEFSDCRFEPACFELPLSKRPEDADPIVYENSESKRVIIRGIVDRVDTLKLGNEVFVRVIDYKTGSKDFSPKDLDEGINLQMFLYLQAIINTKNPEFRERLGAKEGDELIPAGVIYAKTSIKDAVVKHADDKEAAKAASELAEREGMVLDEEASLGAMNPRFTPLKYPETSRSKKSNDERKYTRENWEEIAESMKDAVLSITDRMRTGDIAASPKEIKKNNPCDYCSFGAICRSAKY